MSTTTTRRAFAAGLALAPAVALPAVAGAMGAPPLSGGLAQAIARHKVAFAAFIACHGPEDIPEDINDADSEAIEAVALAPCASDAELLVKLRYLLAYEKYLWRAPDIREQFGPVVVAVDLHFNPEA